jgi:hypothetical protein
MKVAIMTNFQDFPPGYSLTGIVKDQVEMLTRFGNEVHLFVSTKYNSKEKLPEGTIVHKKVPFAHLKDYNTIADISVEHNQVTNETAEMIKKEFTELGIDIAFTHDFIFTGWNIIYGLACKEVTCGLKTPFLHWVHSIPTGGRPFWNINAYGENQKIIWPNRTDMIRVAEQYRGQHHHVRCIPHIKDLRTFFDFSEDTRKFIDAHPNMMQADIVCVLPASVDRLIAKRIDYVMHILAAMKNNLNKSVFFVVCNQWATGKKQKEDTNRYRRTGVNAGLVDGKELAFTSDMGKEYEVGVPIRMVRELFLCSNLFIFPTREESFGLVVPEAALAGGPMMVLNKSLQMQTEITDNKALYFEFGSFHQEFNPPGPRYWDDLAFIIWGRMQQNESVMTRTFVRQQYNMDNLYRNYYAPIMMEMTRGK